MTSQASFPAVPYGLHAGFLQSVQRYPQRPALDVDGKVWAYQALYEAAAAIAAALQDCVDAPAAARVGVLAQRSRSMYCGLLGTLMAGHTLVPLNPSFPVSRTAQMIGLAGAAALVVDKAGEGVLDELLGTISPGCQVLMPERTAEEVNAWQLRWPQHQFHEVARRPAANWQPVSVTPETLAYVFFTSGSTGTPKGVGVQHRNALRFVDMSLERYASVGLSEQDRFSQFYDITFDSSMFDLYVCWAYGACLCCPSAFEWINPNKYIEAKQLTVTDFVPSTGHALNRGQAWRAGRFPHLRLCRFGGEALSADLAAQLAQAAPNAVVENVYGPTECTVDAAYYRWDPLRGPQESEHGIVPIGFAGPQVGLLIVDDKLECVPQGESGELLISGPQVTPGYWQDPERTAKAFIRLPGQDVVYYRTGDLVRQPTPDAPIVYLGRMDQQIKISGVRIELGEIEQILREVAGAEQAVAIGWPRSDSGATGIVAFIEASTPGDSVALREALKQRLPSVMVPRDIFFLATLPLNVNSKVDRKALLEGLESGTFSR